MITLSAPLDNVRFDALVEFARGRLPSLAPDWTDYNYSDPGITLIELLAWIADSQIYSIGRNRRDERIAMAGLLGIRMQGAVPASGTVFPTGDRPDPQQIPAGARLIPSKASAPRLETAHAVDLQHVGIAQLVSETPAGAIDFTAANLQARAAFPAFGDPPSPDAALRVVLEGSLAGRPGTLALGFEIEGTDAQASDALGKVSVFHVAPDGSETPVTVIGDFTANLQRSGVMILTLPEGALGEGLHSFVVRPAPNAALAPNIVRVAPNALPVIQQATLKPDAMFATGRVGQTFTIEPLGLFQTDEIFEGRAWRLVQRGDGLAFDLRIDGDEGWRRSPAGFDSAGPRDKIYTVTEQPDGERIVLRFGNGVNGLRPPVGAAIEAEMQVSAGRNGNVAAGLGWTLDGHRGVWLNRAEIAGGQDAQDLEALLARLREMLDSDRTLATDQQILKAVEALPASFGIARAWVEPGWEPGRRRPAVAATRTLLVSRRDSDAETAAWRRAIGRSLRSRIPLAERLVVASPRWRRLRIRAEVIAAQGRVPGAVAEEVRRELVDRLNPDGTRGAAWPLGRAVTAVAVGGWIRRLPGVAGLDKIELLDDQGRPLEDNVLRLGRGELPWLVTETDDDIQVAIGGRR